jgi:hypothetical protein
MYVERIHDDNNYYHLYHRHPIREKQHMQLNISQLVKHDLNFGIMAKEALKVSRLEWPKDVICWIGCHREIVNSLESAKVEQSL